MAYLRPDGKTQVTIAYDGDRRSGSTPWSSPASTPPRVAGELLQPAVGDHVIEPVLEELGHRRPRTSDYRPLNPTGRFEIGGPMGDAGLTGRKIIVDTYGGIARHGGGAFSGKDPSKVDRSAAYAMRWVAKNVVAAGLARRCEVQVAYAIGKAQPVGLYLETFGTETVPVEDPGRHPEVFDLRPAAIIRARPAAADLQPTAAYGHFGRTGDGTRTFTWERTDQVDALRRPSADRRTGGASLKSLDPRGGTGEPTATGTARRRRRSRPSSSTPLPHLDRLFDYAVPPGWPRRGAGVARAGAVRRARGRRLRRRAPRPPARGPAGPLRRVVSPEPVLTPEVGPGPGGRRPLRRHPR